MSDVPVVAPATDLATRFRAVRARTRTLAAPLSAEDATVQSMPDASPSKWHLAHTTWFFERFVLGARAGYAPCHAQWDYLFNSYYNGAGPMHARAQRGLVTRPTLDDVLAYRDEIDLRVGRRLDAGDFDEQDLRVLLLGTHHEQQHQELLLTDIKHAFWCNPLQPAYRADLVRDAAADAPLRWIAGSDGIAEIGAPAWPDAGRFAFDSESPRHRALLQAHALASRPVSNAEYRAFIDDGAYATATLWLSEAWARLQSEGWRHPLYWDDDAAREFTLGGWRDLDPHAPACHLSYYEADAFARWAGARLPTEFEWEQAAAGLVVAGNLLESDALHPQGAPAEAGLEQMFGDVWEWTASAYTAYPGFRALGGTLGEYNGKFMCAQWVLRGGSCFTPGDHLRASYRNFFPADARWQVSGLRLAKDAA